MASIHKFFIFFVFVLSLQTIPCVSEEFFFKGKVQTKDGMVDIKSSYAIRVMQDLIHGQMITSESEGLSYLLYQSLFDNYDQFNYYKCNAWCGTYWENQPCQCVQVIETDDENSISGEYLCASEIEFMRRPFAFTGNVQTIEGEKYVEKCVAVTVKEDLAEFLEDDDMEITTDKAFEYFFNDEGELEYTECNAYCVTYCSTGKPDFLPNSINECLKVIESSNANVSPGKYLCGCNIQFHHDSTTEEDQQNDEAMVPFN